MIARRRFLTAGAGLAAALRRAPAGRLAAQGAPVSAGPADPKLIEDLVAANRILVEQGVLDGYGHVSVAPRPRPEPLPDVALASRPSWSRAADVLEYDLDSVPVDPRGRTSYLERFIHGEIYKARPDVMAVVHSHSPSVIPFGATGVPLRPLYHMSAFLVGGVPVFDIRAASGAMTDMLVKTPALGAALARTLGRAPVALMRGHGAVVVGRGAAPGRVPERLHGGERQAPGPGDGPRRPDHLSRPGRGTAGRGVDRGHARPALGALAEEGAVPLTDERPRSRRSGGRGCAGGPDGRST